MKSLIKKFIPPVILDGYHRLSPPAKRSKQIYRPKTANEQELNIYWTEQMAFELEHWGENHTWHEIECLLVNCEGKVLDIACGTGVNIMKMQRFKQLDIYGCDISDFLIKKAIQKGISPIKLKVEDATKTSYADGEFDYSYSIGSLEHFTEAGIERFLMECSRYTTKASFHQIPVSESNIDEGWIRTNQSYNNNSIEWWLRFYNRHFRDVQIIGSGYKDEGISIGKWFICRK